MNRTRIAAAAAVGALALAGCTPGNEALREDQEAASQQLDRLNTAQPVPSFAWSQIRQNLIELTLAQAETTQTTSFFFNLGSADPIAECPSIGFPIPTTAQLTNPEQNVRVNSGGERATLPQVEQTGIYTGDSTGTYVICVNGNGDAYAFYWEGFVSTVAGPAEWDSEAARIRLVGDPTFDFSEGR